jgi:anti-anti-sigma factor
MKVSRLDRRPRRDAFTVTGEVDLSTSFALFDALLPAVLSVESDVVLVTMAGVTFFDSTGLDVLLGLNEIATVWGKDLLIVEPSHRVLRLLELSGRAYNVRQSVCSGTRTTYLKL